MRKTVCLLVLLLTACTAITPTPTAIPPTASPTIEPTPTLTPTPDARTRMFNNLQDEGINVTHIVGDAGGGWELLVNGEEVPGAFFDEEGEALQVQLGDRLIKIPGENADDRLQLNADGILLLNDGNGKIIATFDPANPEAGWVEVIKQFPLCSAEMYIDCKIDPVELGKDGDYAKWAKSQLAGLVLPVPDPKKVLIAMSAEDLATNFFYIKARGGDLSEADRPYLAGFTYGYMEADFVLNDNSLYHAVFVVVPIALSVPGKPGQFEIINVLFQANNGMSDEVFIEYLIQLQTKGALRLTSIDGKYVIYPISAENLANFPDMKERIKMFKETLDPTYIKGIIFQGHFLK